MDMLTGSADGSNTSTRVSTSSRNHGRCGAPAVNSSAISASQAKNRPSGFSSHSRPGNATPFFNARGWRRQG